MQGLGTVYVHECRNAHPEEVLMGLQSIPDKLMGEGVILMDGDLDVSKLLTCCLISS